MTLEEEAERLKRLIDEVNNCIRNIANQRGNVVVKTVEGVIDTGYLSPSIRYPYTSVKITKDL
jgi:hypothetical protein